MRNIDKTKKIEDYIKKLILGQTVLVKFLNFNNYIEKKGMIIKIDREEKVLYLPNYKIPFANIIAIIS